MNKLQQIRKENGLSQEEIASRIGISQQAYARYEKNSNELPVHIRKKIEDSLLCDLGEHERDITGICGFLDNSYTAFHAVDNCKKILLDNGFEELKESEKLSVKKGGSYFITKNNSAILAFKVGDLSSYTFNIASCHTDSPCLKVKGKSLLPSPEGYRLNVERYGGLINYSLLDIPLCLAGRICVENKHGFEEKLYCSNFNVNIPSLCIHHNPSVNDGMQLNNQVDMLPLLGNCTDFYKLLSPNEKIIDSDLYCVPAIKSTFTGATNEFLVSPRIDNLSSLYSIMKGIIAAKPKGIAILYATDNEEIGSLSKQGAESSFLDHVIRRINSALGKRTDDYTQAISNGFVLSIDNGHAVHPNHPEKSDPDQRVYLNKGVVIKHHPNYSTDGVSSSIVKVIADKGNVKIQEYYNKSDVRCGSTIGKVTSTQLEINACDIGLAQLAMHSGIETVGKNDIAEMTKLVKTFFETTIEIKDNNYSIK